MSRKNKAELLMPTVDQIRAQFNRFIASHTADLKAGADEIDAKIKSLEDTGANPLYYLSKNDDQKLSPLAFENKSLSSAYPALLLHRRAKQREIERLASVYNDETLFVELFEKFLQVPDQAVSRSLSRHFWQLLGKPTGE